MTTLLEIPGFRWNSTLTITAVVAALILVAGLLLTIAPDTTRRREIGLALVSGGVFVVGSGFIQAAVDISGFRNSLTFTQDLSGFDPDGRSLQGFNLNGKRFATAYLVGANLKEADLVRSNFEDANLDGGHFEDANLNYAVFGSKTTLPGAQFDRAQLIGTKINGIKIADAHFPGASVHQETCWRIPTKYDPKAHDATAVDKNRMIPTEAGQTLLNHLLNEDLKPLKGANGERQPIGHICTTDEGGLDEVGSADKRRRIYICLNEPHLRKFSENPDKVALSCEMR